ncbi:MAG TPA: metallophosphoesterase [Polyangia bacterium]|jgi:3',5'-cyclic AMP phosphodiesterase CpdA
MQRPERGGTFRLAHVTDPHFRGSFAGASPMDFVGKRALGGLNLVVNRRRKHKMELLEALRLDLRAQAPDHLALTGDLSNVSLPGEWRAALAWIDGCGLPAAAISVIPGNHDAYVEEVVASRAFEKLFAPYMTSDLARAGEGGAGVDRPDYPYAQIRDGVAFVGVSSSVATGDFGAWGRVGDAQLARLEAVLAAPELAGKTRVVMIHHPPIRQKHGEERNLKDRAAFAEVLGRAGADLVLHGHDHQDEHTELGGPGGTRIPVIGAGSASYTGGAERRARYNLYEIAGGQITLITRAHDEASDAFKEVRRERLV